jgi:hypothetical protein
MRQQAIVIRKGQTQRANDDRVTIAELCERDHITIGGCQPTGSPQFQSSSNQRDRPRHTGRPAFAGHDRDIPTLPAIGEGMAKRIGNLLHEPNHALGVAAVQQC